PDPTPRRDFRGRSGRWVMPASGGPPRRLGGISRTAGGSDRGASPDASAGFRVLPEDRIGGASPALAWIGVGVVEAAPGRGALPPACRPRSRRAFVPARA